MERTARRDMRAQTRLERSMLAYCGRQKIAQLRNATPLRLTSLQTLAPGPYRVRPVAVVAQQSQPLLPRLLGMQLAQRDKHSDESTNCIASRLTPRQKHDRIRRGCDRDEGARKVILGTSWISQRQTMLVRAPPSPADSADFNTAPGPVSSARAHGAWWLLMRISARRLRRD